MSTGPWEAIARIFKTRDSPEPVGAGFLVGNALVVTCAHTIGNNRPVGELWIDFPFLRTGERWPAIVHPKGWWPYNKARPHDGRTDVALLQLQEPIAAVEPLNLAREAPRTVSVRAYGFPEGHSLGQWMYGELHLEPRADGWLQLSGRSGNNYFICPGFSGAPVFADNGEQVIGMVSQFDRGSFLEAFLVPASILRELLNLLSSDNSNVKTDDSINELIELLKRMGTCAHSVQHLTNDWQLAQMIRRLAELTQNCLINLDQLGVTPLAFAYGKLERLARAVDIDDRLSGCFDPAPMSELLALLDRLIGNAERPLFGSDVLIPNDLLADPPPQHLETVLRIIEEADRLCGLLREEPWQLIAEAFLPAVCDLMMLGVHLHQKEVNGREVEATRTRLERYRAFILRETLVRTELFLARTSPICAKVWCFGTPALRRS